MPVKGAKGVVMRLVRDDMHGNGRKWETLNFDFDKFEHAKFSKTSITNGGSKLKFKVFWVMSYKKFASSVKCSRKFACEVSKFRRRD